MPSAHTSLHYHIVFCTKGRRRFIAEPWREELHAYIGGITRDLGAVASSIGGTADHVRILAGLKVTHTLADMVRQMKRGSFRMDSSTRGKQIRVAGGLWRLYREPLAPPHENL